MQVKFADFLRNEEMYRAAERYWHQAFSALPCAPFESGWRRWGKANFHLRSETGDNIYAAINDTLRRGITLVQCMPTECQQELVAWTGRFGEGFDDGQEIDYVKINLVHTDETEKLALFLLSRFVCDRISLKEMDDVIAELGVG